MGTDNLLTRVNTAILSEWFNVLKSALCVDHVPRNSSGTPTSGAGSLGTIDYPWNNIRAANLFLNGSPVVASKVTTRPHRISSAKATANGFPNFLTPAGAGSGLSAVLSATATPFSFTANNTEVTISADQTYSSLTAAPSSNNTCLINDALLAGGAETKLLGEFDSKPLAISTVGSAITALNGSTAAFLVGTEVFLAIVDTTNNCLRPIFRGWAGTVRGTLTNGATVTLLKINTLLMKNDGATKIASVYFPVSVAVLPAASTAGRIYIDRSTGKQYYDSGTTLSASYLIIGYAVCTSADCVYVQTSDIDLFWTDEIDFDFRIDDTTSVRVSPGAKVSVCGKVLEFPDEQHVTQASDMDSGESIAANSIFFIYCTSAGALVYSSIYPRKPDPMKAGAYHPSKYYRCVGAAQTGATSNFYFKRHEKSSVETVAAGMVPVGTVVPIVTGYFGDGSNGSFTTVVVNTAAGVNAALPSNWRVCDGALLNDPESPLFMGATRYLPNITDSRFVMGFTSSGAIGGANTKNLGHNHNIAHLHIWAAKKSRDLFGLQTSQAADSITSISNTDYAYCFLNSATVGGTTDIAYQYYNDVETDYYTTGALSPPEGTSGSAAASSTAGSATQDIVPSNLSSIYAMRVK